jgi:prolyl 4-hydroxylase
MSSKRIQLSRACSIPPIYVIDDFLTASELEYFQSKIKSIPFEKSFVDNMDFEKKGEQQDSTEYHDGNKNDTSPLMDLKKTGHKRQRRTMVDTHHRTSTFFSFRKLHDSRISALESRVADFLGCWVHQIEAIQLVRYLPGQFFGVHHDLGDLLENDQVTLPPKHLAVKRRLVTIFCYLNTLETDQGGCTHFPKCNGLRVRPQMGRAVLWCNITADGLPDPRTIHAGEPVLAETTRTTSDGKPNTKQHADTSSNDTVKYGLNIWICEE